MANNKRKTPIASLKPNILKKRLECLFAENLNGKHLRISLKTVPKWGHTHIFVFEFHVNLRLVSEICIFRALLCVCVCVCVCVRVCVCVCV